MTGVPLLYPSEQSVPQFMPAGPEVIVPEPVPDLETDRRMYELILNVAETVQLPVIAPVV